MYRVLIVDDEPAIVNGLAKMFQENEKLELEIYKAYSGYDAVEVMKHNRIDIVLSDIRMPGMTGLQLRDQIIFYWPFCKVIFLTGYNEFEYVYEAIHKPAENYLLKTERDEVVIAAVEEAIRKIKQEKEQWDIVSLAQKQLKEVAPLKRKELFEAILTGEIGNGDYLCQQFEELEIGLEVENPVLMVMGSVHYGAVDFTHQERLNAIYLIQKMVEKSMEPYIMTVGTPFEQSKVMWFLQPNSKYERFHTDESVMSWEDFIIYIKGELEKVQDACEELLEVSVTFFIARKAAKCCMLFKEFDLMRSVASKSLSNSSRMIIDLSRPNEFLTNTESSLVMEHIVFYNKIRLLEHSLENGKQDEFEVLCREIIYAFKIDFTSFYLINTERYYQFVLVFLSYINKNEMGEKLSEDIKLERLTIMEIPADWERAEKTFVGLGKYLCMLRAEKLVNEDSQIIIRLNRYISENPGGDLSLTRLAQMVHFNPSYLSRFYKQVTGRNLSDYINEVKLTMSKAMLDKMDLKVNEIANKLGFDSPSYFTSFFKKMTGMTPQEYRNEIF